jgi:hypothetical protein
LPTAFFREEKPVLRVRIAEDRSEGSEPRIRG